MTTHLWVDALAGIVVASSPWVFSFDRRVWAPHLVLGLLLVALALTASFSIPMFACKNPDPQLDDLGVVPAFALTDDQGAVFTEEALRAANRRWIERYERVEALAASRGQVLAELSPEAKDQLWNEVKAG